MTKFGIRALIALTIFAAGFSGCSQEGTLVIKNSATTEFTGFVDGTQVTIDPSDSYKTTVYIGKSLSVIGPDQFPVVVSGSATTKRFFSEEIDVKSGETTTFKIADDTGALVFTNMHLGSVNEIASRPCDSLTFGPNLLEEKRTIPPGSDADNTARRRMLGPPDQLRQPECQGSRNRNRSEYRNRSDHRNRMDSGLRLPAAGSAGARAVTDRD